ncbi:MAG: histidine phosphatase family protein [Herbiconiux sp.]|uniref:histidine phosphatase family protein n=1 Tax=Herbiconiux sp. TaxID=1871186 RepID=UPI00122766FF|nr:histidine phosphatase family protein [Herbiconiux sp.]TAJ49311.1 MAG: histidine phosphatase family protein [Herbiconiux sp.]
MDVVPNRIHLVRHGEVHNPDGLLYGRLPGFHLSRSGVRMAQLAADELVAQGYEVKTVMTSPLERAQESAEPIAAAFGRPASVDVALIEASSRLEGGRFQMNLGILAKPAAWRFLVNPLRPSWGEPFAAVAARMMSLIQSVAGDDSPGDVVMVSHQLPIWMAHRAVLGTRLFHDPRKRRCSLSSITSFEVRDGAIREVGYSEPAAALIARSKDVGAV